VSYPHCNPIHTGKVAHVSCPNWEGNACIFHTGRVAHVCILTTSAGLYMCPMHSRRLGRGDSYPQWEGGTYVSNPTGRVERVHIGSVPHAMSATYGQRISANG
jgi:hypothetical protein